MQDDSITQPVIYNVTTAVMPFIEAEWLSWMKYTHIPEVLDTGCFYKYQLVKLADTGDAEHATYAVQYYAEDESRYQEYNSQHAPALKKAVHEKWGENAFSFASLMHIMK